MANKQSQSSRAVVDQKLLGSRIEGIRGVLLEEQIEAAGHPKQALQAEDSMGAPGSCQRVRSAGPAARAATSELRLLAHPCLALKTGQACRSGVYEPQPSQMS